MDGGRNGNERDRRGVAPVADLRARRRRDHRDRRRAPGVSRVPRWRGARERRDSRRAEAERRLRGQRGRRADRGPRDRVVGEDAALRTRGGLRRHRRGRGSRRKRIAVRPPEPRRAPFRSRLSVPGAASGCEFPRRHRVSRPAGATRGLRRRRADACGRGAPWGVPPPRVRGAPLRRRLQRESAVDARRARHVEAPPRDAQDRRAGRHAGARAGGCVVAPRDGPVRGRPGRPARLRRVARHGHRRRRDRSGIRIRKRFRRARPGRGRRAARSDARAGRRRALQGVAGRGARSSRGEADGARVRESGIGNRESKEETHEKSASACFRFPFPVRSL